MSKQYVLGQKPVINRSRSSFPMSYKHLTSFNVGDLVPLYFQDVLPGDTFKVKSYNVIRTTTPFIKPVMDNLVFDMYYFFVPMRLVWDNTEEFFGENKTGYWTQQQTFQIPSVSGPVTKNTIADYLGIPPLNYGEDESYLELNILPFRAYALIWNEWFRSENLQEPVYIYKGSNGDTIPYFNNNEFGPNNFLGKCAKVNKLQDYFTSCLPSPQKGDAVTLKFANGTYVNDYVTDLGGLLGESTISMKEDVSKSLLWNDSEDLPANLDLSGVDIANVNDLRMAFALQRMLEKDARGGTRYIEYIQEHFSVTNPDYRLQRPEFLGGKRMPLNIQQVASTSVSGDSELGDLGAYSLSNGECGFNKGFTEHGFIIGLGCVRYKHTYSQGLERIWTKKLRTDIYDPVFANIGEQPVYSYELDSNIVFDSGNDLNRVFGYNEAWAHYRYKPNRVSGEMRPDSNSGLDVYHFADNYNNVPVLGDEFIKETALFVDRTLISGSKNTPNFIADFYHDVKAIRCMPTYSIPGLIDHK